MSLNKEDSDTCEEFEEEFSDDDDGPNVFNYGLGLGHVRRLEQENELSRANLANIELKLIGSNSGEPSSKKSKRTSLIAPNSGRSVVPTPNLLTDSFSSIRKCSQESTKSCSKIDTSFDYFADRISDEIVLKIFSYLTRQELVQCMSVCRRFYRIGCDDSLWKKVNLFDKHHIPPGGIGLLLRRGVTYLSLCNAQMRSPVIVQRLSTPPTLKIRPSKLKYLDLTMATLAITDLEAILACCRSLEKLSLEKLELNDNICKHIARNGDTMNVLNASHCEGITLEGLQEIVMNCQSLTRVNFGWTNLSQESMQFLCENLTPQVVKLNVAGGRRTMTDKCVGALVTRCNKLVSLDISDSVMLTGATIDAITQHLSGSLTTLSLSRNFYIPPIKYCELSRDNMPHLEVLNIYGLFGRVSSNLEKTIRSSLPHVSINKVPFCYIARPFVQNKRNMLWDITFPTQSKPQELI